MSRNSLILSEEKKQQFVQLLSEAMAQMNESRRNGHLCFLKEYIKDRLGNSTIAKKIN